jgi:hypothetical protein
MHRERDLVFFIISMIIPVGFVLAVWLDRRYAGLRWARIASVVACAAGLSWHTITLHQRPLSLERYPFLWAVSVKQMLGGIFIGMAITIVMARPRKTPKDENSSHGTSKA